MPDSIPDGIATGWGSFHQAPGRAPHQLERLAAVCLRAEADDGRLGDLSEQYVRTHEATRAHLGTAPWAMAASHVAADLRYLLATANVMLFTRAVDPGLHAAESGVAAFVAFDLRERLMAMVQFAVRRLALPALLLLCSALLINSAVDVWRNWRQTDALMASVQREKAEVAAQRIDAFVSDVERQVGWVTSPDWTKFPADQRRFDYVRLLRQTPALTALTQLDRQGHEQLVVNRLSMDVVDSNIDRSGEPAFVGAMANKVYYGPVYFRRGSEPYMTMAIANVRGTGVTAVEVNLSLIWDVINAVKVGETGFAYIVDGKGRLIAHRDEKLAQRLPSFSALPQVAAALAGPPSGELVDGQTFGAFGPREPVRSVHAVIPRQSWRVFVDLPTAETSASFWGAVIRGVNLLGLGIVAAVLAILLAARPVTLARPARA